MNNIIEYSVIVYYSKIDGHYIAEVPDLPGCMADGNTYAEAAANADIIMREWIESALLDGEPIPEPNNNLISQLLEMNYVHA